MTIQKIEDGSRLTIALEGRLDTTTSPELEAEWNKVKENVTDLVVDLEKLEYMSSAGLRVMLSMHNTMAGKGSLKVVHVNQMIQEIFDITGFSSILDIE